MPESRQADTMNTPGSILLGAVILAATYAALNVYEVRTYKQTLWRLNRVTGEVAFCNRRACYHGYTWRDVSAEAVARNRQPRGFTIEEALGNPAVPDKPPAKAGE